jgi:hypothetical protein
MEELGRVSDKPTFREFGRGPQTLDKRIGDNASIEA